MNNLLPLNTSVLLNILMITFPFFIGCDRDDRISLEDTAIQYELAVSNNPVDTGSVSVSNGLLDAETNLEIEATPSSGYKFINWTGSIASTNNPLSVTMDSHKVLVANYEIEVVIGSLSPAPIPPVRETSNVISLYSDAYSDSAISVDFWSAAWDDSDIEDVVIAGNNAKKITFTNFIGIEFLSDRQDASGMTHFHMDFWTDEADLDGKVFNSKFSQWGGGNAEVSALELNINTATNPAIVSGTWVSIDVPITNFVNDLTRNDLAQFVITSNMAEVYIDNIYLYKE